MAARSFNPDEGKSKETLLREFLDMICESSNYFKYAEE